MTDIERKALALVNEVLAEWGALKNAVEVPKNSDAFARALLRAIEQHDAFRQEVSDAVVKLGCWPDTVDLGRFIIAKPDPLVEVIDDMNANPQPFIDSEHYSKRLRAAIEKRGGKITWGEG